MSEQIKVVVRFVLLIALILVLSVFSVRIWGGEPETIPVAQTLIFQEGMTIAEFARQNNIPIVVLKEAFRLEAKQDLQRGLNQLGLSHGEISTRIDKAMALQAERESKNWVKILVKFALWIAFLLGVFSLMRKMRITAKVRKGLYLTAILVFGVILGSDPSPMGTVKDAIVLLGAKGAIFPPRMIALSVFLIMVLVANKFICSWGCQLGTLQDLIFRLNRDTKDKSGVFKQYKIPFVTTNGIRLAFFFVLTLVALLWAVDIVEPIDPFKVYKPAAIGAVGAVFIGAVLVAGLFVYRPWCHLFCPFGLVGWTFEKISIFKIIVDYETCIACETCAKACPSTVMTATLKRENVIPDCFSCGTCIEVCPTGSIHLLTGSRPRPPLDKFKKNKENLKKE